MPRLTYPSAIKRSRFTIVIVPMLVCFLCTQCGTFSGGEMVTKPRIHKSHYKKSSSKKRLRIGRFRLPTFERSGVKKVRMKG